MSDLLRRALVSVRTTTQTDGRLSLFARSHKAVLGKGWSFDVAEPELTGAENLLGLLAADVLGLFLELCHKRRVLVDEIEATVKAELVNPLPLLGVIGSTGEPHFDSFALKAYIGTSADGAAIAEIWGDAIARAPLANTLRRAATVELQHQLS